MDCQNGKIQDSFDDGHIIFIIEDDLVIDYKTSQLSADDLRNIFAGKVTERTPQVVKGGPGTNVFLFWSGHGARDNVLKWADGNLDAETFRSILSGAEGNYRKMLAVSAFPLCCCQWGDIPCRCNGEWDLSFQPIHAHIPL